MLVIGRKWCCTIISLLPGIVDGLLSILVVVNGNDNQGVTRAGRIHQDYIQRHSNVVCGIFQAEK